MQLYFAVVLALHCNLIITLLVIRTIIADDESWQTPFMGNIGHVWPYVPRAPHNLDESLQ